MLMGALRIRYSLPCKMQKFIDVLAVFLNERPDDSNVKVLRLENSLKVNDQSVINEVRREFAERLGIEQRMLNVEPLVRVCGCTSFELAMLC